MARYRLSWAGVLVTFPVAVIKCLGRSNLGEGGFILAYRSSGAYSVLGRSQTGGPSHPRQEADHEYLCLLHFLLYAQFRLLTQGVGPLR